MLVDVENEIYTINDSVTGSKDPAIRIRPDVTDVKRRVLGTWCPPFRVCSKQLSYISGGYRPDLHRIADRDKGHPKRPDTLTDLRRGRVLLNAPTSKKSIIFYKKKNTLGK